MANYDLTYEGSRVQGILDTGNSLKDAGYIFRGEATPSTVPGTPTERVAYIGGPGTYTNFGSSITVGAGCICVFKYTGSAWSNQVINTGLDSAVNTLQSAITAINNNIGNGYVYAGVATPSTSPVTGKVFYLAVQAGTYTNFGNAVVTAGLNVIKYNGSAWSVDQVIAIDAEPTQGSANLVKSGGVLNSIIQNGPAFDLSAYNAHGGVLATYADLSAALTALNALPADFKKGGMSVKFVQSSDNNYTQFRCKTQSFSADPEDWYFEGDGTLVENPEFIYVKTDKDDKILWAIKTDGSIYYGAGVPQQIVDYIEEKIADLSLDEYEDIVAFLADLEKGDETLQDLLDKKVDGEYVENPEFVDAKTDSENKLLEGTRKDGTKVFGGDVEVGRKMSSPEISSDKIFLEGIELSPASTVDVTEIIEDPENRLEIETDSEEKIISYRDKDGMLHEEVGVKTNSLQLTDTGMTEFQQALKDAGFNPGGAGDWSDAKDLQIPIPRCASINIVVDDNIDFTKLTKPNKEGAEVGVTIEVPSIVEFCDMQGNYFKKHALIQGQGTSSLAFDKRNFAFDFFNEDPTSESFDEDNTFKITFGDWVACDSFHAKAYYTDFFRGISLISYQVANEVWKSRGIEKDRPWKKALINESDFDTRIHYAGGVNDMSLQIDNGARCIPDGFPAVIYRNGEFWGLYTFCLKKARENYHTIKNNPSHIHLDGELGNAEFWCGTVKWSAFEIRNPKKLVYAYNVFDVYDEAVSYKAEAIVCDADKKNAYFSKQSNNLGHPLTDTAYWGIASDNLYKYDADVLQAEIAGNADGSTVYSQWTAGNYAAGEIRSHTIDGISHLFMNTVADNDKEPIIQYDAEKDKWYNLDDDPDFKNKSKCGWINVTNTVKVKESIIAFSKVVPQIEAANTDEAKKALFESVFDTGNMIDYNITTNFLWNQDGFRKNWQWLTWDGIHWYACFYDMDCVYGAWHKGNIISTNYSALIVDDEGGLVTPGHYPFSLYPTEVKARWSELVSKGILTQENVINKVKDWLLRYGENDFKKEWKKWPESPCNRDDNTVTEFWTRNNYKTTREASYISAGYTLWDANTTYSEGAKVVIGPIDKGYYYGFVAKNTEGNTGIYPITPYSDYPIALGLHDSIWRLNAYARRVSTNLSNLINGL